MKATAGFLALALALMAGASGAQIQATTSDGREVILNEDFTWRYAEEQAAESTPSEPGAESTPSEPGAFVVLELQRKFGTKKTCTFGVRAVNEQPYMIESLVPQFAAYNTQGVVVDNVYQSITLMKPTQSRYFEVKFSGLSCEEVSRVQVHGADRCTMGKMDVFNLEPGVCLSHISLRPSSLVDFSK